MKNLKILTIEIFKVLIYIYIAMILGMIIIIIKNI